ncbi:MAG: formylglycine-generating enzyme family protein [Alphaproteobacteria bacterium]|nr:formylglycine-generating enzyme family protein [Alphaproteobacteria bacterium]
MRPWTSRALGLALLTAAVALPVWWSRVTRDVPEPIPVVQPEAPQPLRPVMVQIPLPTEPFLMGSTPETDPYSQDDEAQHPVLLTRPYLIARTEVTQVQYRAVMGVDPMRGDEDCERAGLGDDLPVVCVSWFDAVAYCNRLSELEGLTPAYVVEGDAVRWTREADGYRLPTEAEWEYAARAGGMDRWAGMDDEADLCAIGNIADLDAQEVYEDWTVAPCGDGAVRLAAVGSYAANPWTLHDLTGNAWEWTWDRYTSDIRDLQLDPEGPSTGSLQVIRGGSWGSIPAAARVTRRYWGQPSGRLVILGFRVARSSPSAL